MKRHHWLILGAVVLCVGAWLAWNVLLVGGDLSIPPPESPGAPAR